MVSTVFGTSSKVIDLVPAEPDDGIRIYPPSVLGDIEIDTKTPVHYYWKPDNFGGCGVFFAFVRTIDGGVLEAAIGFYNRDWYRIEDEQVYETYSPTHSTVHTNPGKVWHQSYRILQSRDLKEKEVFIV